MRLLIAEPERDNGLLLKRAFEAAGHEVLGPATTVDEALALAQARPPELAVVHVELGGRGRPGVTAQVCEDLGEACLYLGEPWAVEPTPEDASRSARRPEPLLRDVDLAQALLNHIARSRTDEG